MRVTEHGIISSHTRTDALADGILMDISDAARGGAVSAARSRTRYRSALCRIPNAAGAHGPEELRLNLHIGPGNTPEPVLTILLPAEDQEPPKGPARSPDRADRDRADRDRADRDRAEGPFR
jgi:hypothetical protein